MAWYDGQVNGEQARVNERPNRQIEVLYHFTGLYNNSPHDHMVTAPDGINVEYWRENGIDRIDNRNLHQAYPDTPHEKR